MGTMLSCLKPKFYFLIFQTILSINFTLLTHGHGTGYFMPKIMKLIFFLVFGLNMNGCAYFGADQASNSDPFTGGVNTSNSALLDIPLPAGLQIYPGHGFKKSSGEGLEILRGYISINNASEVFFQNLKNQGWELKTALQNKGKAFYLYQKNKDYSAIIFYPQGALTIIELWRGQELPPGSQIQTRPYEEETPSSSLVPEEYGPLSGDENTQVVPKGEVWGKKSVLEEKEL